MVRSFWALALGVIGIAAAIVRADSGVSNLANQTSGVAPITNNTIVTAGPSEVTPDLNAAQYQAVATSFTTGSSDTNLDKVTVKLDAGTGSGLTLYIAVDNGDTPGHITVLLNGNDSPSTAGNYDYVPNDTLTMTASTKFWLVISAEVASPGSVFGGDITDDTSETGDAGWSIGDDLEVLGSSSQLAIRQPKFANPWSSAGATPLQFSISPSAVPEPVGMAAMLCALGVVGRRRTRKKIR